MLLVQFGDGKFLRGFIPSLLHRLSNGEPCKIVVIAPLRKRREYESKAVHTAYSLRILGQAQSTSDSYSSETRNAVANTSGALDAFDTNPEQGYRYTKPGLYDLAPYEKSINPYTQFQDFLELACDSALRYIVSNTTEQGFAVPPEDTAFEQEALQQCPISFPEKLAAFLAHRFLHARKALLKKRIEIVPTELLLHNGDLLCSLVLKICTGKKVSGLIEWIKKVIVFRNTLVDRIVIEGDQKTPGRMLVSEPYLLWAIEDKAAREKVDATWGFLRSPNIMPWYERKIHILNAGHLILLAMHREHAVETVHAAMHKDASKHMFFKIMQTEVLPYVHAASCDAYLALCVARFSQEGLQHRFSAIANNLVEKLRVRILPILVRYWAKNQRLAPGLYQTVLRCLCMHCGSEETLDHSYAIQSCMKKCIDQIFREHDALRAAITQGYLQQSK